MSSKVNLLKKQIQAQLEVKVAKNQVFDGTLPIPIGKKKL